MWNYGQYGLPSWLPLRSGWNWFVRRNNWAVKINGNSSIRYIYYIILSSRTCICAFLFTVSSRWNAGQSGIGEIEIPNVYYALNICFYHFYFSLFVWLFSTIHVYAPSLCVYLIYFYSIIIQFLCVLMLICCSRISVCFFCTRNVHCYTRYFYINETKWIASIIIMIMTCLKF